MACLISLSANKEVHLIKYPGLVNDVEKMINSLGGPYRISQALCGDAKGLELRFHFQNIFSKPVNGEHNVRNGLLLSIKIKKYKASGNSRVCVKILGRSRSCISFDNICDFQYLPLRTHYKSDSGVFILNASPKNATDADFFLDPDVPFFCLPQVFARSDCPLYNIFRNDLHEDGQNEILGVMHKYSYETRAVVTFSMLDPMPSRPDPQLLKRMKVKYVSDDQLQKVQNLFNECPIWTRIALLYESGISNDKLKCIVPSLAYYFSSGPWRTLYVRYGYDPRRDFKSRYYQTFDFRLRYRSGMAEFVENAHPIKNRKKIGCRSSSKCIQNTDYPYFDEDILPRSRQCILRYCDIRIGKIQQMLDKIPSPMTGVTCNDRTGWLPIGFDGQVRQILSNVIKDILRKQNKNELITSDVYIA